MDETILFRLILAAVCLTPVAMALFFWFAFRKAPKLPLWPAAVLLGVACCVIGLSIEPGGLGWIVGLLVPVSGVISVATGIGFCICRLTALSLSKSVLAASVLLLPGVVWLDFRFRVEVRDEAGNRVATGAFDLHRPNYKPFEDYERTGGVRLWKGTVYIGYLRWAAYQDRWVFPDRIGSLDGRLTAMLDWRPAVWSEWPKRVVLVQNR